MTEEEVKELFRKVANEDALKVKFKF